MTDKELLELAAKAAGIKYDKDYVCPIGGLGLFVKGEKHQWYWNPLTDDGDALRLAVKLRIYIDFYNGYGEVWATAVTEDETGIEAEPYGDDPYAATRRAIVRAAAEIGREYD